MLVNTSYKQQFIIAILLAVWLVLFLVLIAPFDAEDLSFKIRLWLMPMYGLIAIIGYMITILIQNKIHDLVKQWNIILEFLTLLLFGLLVLGGSFIYYKTDMVNGDYNFLKFTFQVFFPIMLILLPMLILSRWYLYKKTARSNTDDKITLRGDNKLDILQLKFADLLSISSADNYIEVAYLDKGQLAKKLLRNTLKNASEQKPELIQVHRSHLINPQHIKEWTSTNLINLTYLDIPVSKKYKESILSYQNSSLKGDVSPLDQ